MSLEQQAAEAALAIVKEFPGLNSRQYRLKLGLSEGRYMHLTNRLLKLERYGHLRHEDVVVEGHLKERKWWPV